MTTYRSALRKIGWAAVASTTLLAFSLDLRVAPTSQGGGVSVSIESQAQALFFKDVFKKIGTSIKKLWQKFKKNVLQKVVDFIKKPIEKAKAGIKKIIDKAVAGLKKLLDSKVLIPALAWALPKIFPGFDKFVKFVNQVLGKIDKIAAVASKYMNVVDAYIKGNVLKFKEAVKGATSTMDLLQKLDLTTIVKIAMAFAKEKLGEFVKAKTIDLLEAAYGIIETPIDIGRKAVTTAIGSIPIVGGVLRGVIDAIIGIGLKLLRSKGFEWVADQAVKLSNKLLDKVEKWLLKKAAKLDANPKFQKILEKVKGFLKKAEKYIGPVTAAFKKVKSVFQQLGKKTSFGDVVAAGLGDIAKGLYNKALDWLEKNKSKASKKLGELVGKIPMLGKLKDVVMGGFDQGGTAFIGEARKCDSHIAGSDLGKIAKGLLGCIKDAAITGLKQAGVGAVRGLWNKFVDFLGKNCAKAVDALGSLAGKVAKVIKPAKGLIEPAVNALKAGCSGAVDKVASMNPAK